MKQPQHTKRRTVLKTIGASVIAGTVLTGSAAASDHDLTIKIKDGDTIDEIGEFRFDPRNASVSLGNEGEATVRWENVGSHHHDVKFNQLDVHSPTLHSGGSWEYTFFETVDDSYECTFHPNMRASLRVTE